MDAKKANIIVHSKMADTYNQREPHFRQENQKKVKALLQEIRSMTGEKLLDIGCGTGFIINLAREIFDEIHGVDITEAMLEKVDVSKGNITLHNVSADDLPFEDDYFDSIASYAFLHHLDDYVGVLQESYRVLREGGIFYIDLEPNKFFWDLIQVHKDDEACLLSDIVKNEIDSVCHTDQKVFEEYRIDKEIFNKAEHIKSISGGIDAERFKKDVAKTGFGECKINYQWFAGQGKVFHDQSPKDAERIDSYLQEILPLSRSLFKYLQFIIKK